MTSKITPAMKINSESYLRSILADNDTVYCVIHHLTDTTKFCSFFIVSQGRILDISKSIATYQGIRTDKRGHVCVRACGVSPADQTVSGLSRSLGKPLSAAKP